MGKGNNNETKTVTKAEPWKPLQPYLTDALADAQTIYNRGAPKYYPGETVAPMSNYTKGSLNAMAQRAAAGSPVVRSAQQQLTNTLGGQYLSAGNPYFQGALGAAIRPMINTFTDQVMPGLDSNFSGAGRYGSGAHALASSDAANQLASQVGDVASQMAYQNYGDERQNQLRAMLFAPEMAAQDYKDISMLGLAGQGYDQYNQAKIDAAKAKYDYQQNADMQWIQNYIGLLGGPPPPTQTNTAKTPAPSPWATVAGVGLQAASALGEMPGGGSAFYNPGMIGTFY